MAEEPQSDSPPKLQASSQHVQVLFAGEMIADTHRAYCVLEAGKLPRYYFPPEDVLMQHLELQIGLQRFSKWKGKASFFQIRLAGQVVSEAAWTYLHPNRAYTQIRGYVAFVASKIEACLIDGVRFPPEGAVLNGTSIPFENLG